MLQHLCHSRATSICLGWKQPLLNTISNLDLAATISRRCPPFTETIFAFLEVWPKIVVSCRVLLWFNAVGITFWIWWPRRNQSSCCDFVPRVFFGKDDDVSLWYCCCDCVAMAFFRERWWCWEGIVVILLFWCGLTFWRWSAYRNQQLRTGRSTPAM